MPECVTVAHIVGVVASAETPSTASALVTSHAILRGSLARLFGVTRRRFDLMGIVMLSMVRLARSVALRAEAAS